MKESCSFQTTSEHGITIYAYGVRFGEISPPIMSLPDAPYGAGVAAVGWVLYSVDGGNTMLKHWFSDHAREPMDNYSPYNVAVRLLDEMLVAVVQGEVE